MSIGSPEDGVEIWANLQASFTAVSAYSFVLQPALPGKRGDRRNR